MLSQIADFEHKFADYYDSFDEGSIIINTFGVNTSDWKLVVKNVESNFHLEKF